MDEIELKLALAARGRRGVPARARRSPGCARARRKLTSIYFDTPDCELRDAGMALRLRKAGGRWTQTLKGGTSGTGGLHARGEWEYAAPDASHRPHAPRRARRSTR